MKNLTRRGISVLLILILLLGLGACGKSSEGKSSASAGTVVHGETDDTPTSNRPTIFDDDDEDDTHPNTTYNDPLFDGEEDSDFGGDEDDDWTGPVEEEEEEKKPIDDSYSGATNIEDWLDGPATLWVSPYSKGAKSRPIDAIKWWHNGDDGRYYLFLPAAFSKSDLQIWIQGDLACTLDKTAYENGDALKTLKEGNHTLSLGGTTYPITVMRSANLGAMYIATDSGNLKFIHASKSNKEGGQMKMVDVNGKTVYYDALTSMKSRGNATWKREKKGYQIKLDKKTDLVGGAGAGKTWILLANYLERTMFRNAFAYDLAYEAGLTETSRYTYVDLYCNGEYRGTYQVTEKVQIQENRVAIQDLEEATKAVNTQKLGSYPTFGPKEGTVAGSRKGYAIPKNPKDITGGYLLELDYADRYVDEKSGFVTNRGQAVNIKEPEHASREQVDYIANFFQEFEDACFAEDGKNPSTGKYYYEYFDLTSLARKYIVEEITKNIDTDVTSQYFYKPSDQQSKVGFCGPVWDYDNSMANHGNQQALSPDGIYSATRKKYITNQLYKKDSFLAAVKTEWNKTFKPLLTNCVTKGSSSGGALKTIQEYSKLLAPSAAMNFTRWDNIDKVDTSAYNNTGSTYPEHVAFLKNFLRERLAFLNKEWK